MGQKCPSAPCEHFSLHTSVCFSPLPPLQFRAACLFRVKKESTKVVKQKKNLERVSNDIHDNLGSNNEEAESLRI